MYFKKRKFLISALIFSYLTTILSSRLELAIKNCDTRLFLNTLLEQVDSLNNAQVRFLLAVANNKKIELSQALDLAKKESGNQFKKGLAFSGIVLSAWFAKNIFSNDWRDPKKYLLNIILKKVNIDLQFYIHDDDLTSWSVIYAFLASSGIAYLCSSDKKTLTQDNLIKINAIEYVLKKSKNAIDRLEIRDFLNGKFVENKKNSYLYLACLLGILSSGMSLCTELFFKTKLQSGIASFMTCAAVYCLFKNRLQTSDSDENLNFYTELASQNV